MLCLAYLLGLNQVTKAEKIKSLQHLTAETIIKSIPVTKNENGQFDFGDEEWQKFQKDHYFWEILAKQLIDIKEWPIATDNMNF